MTCANYMNQEAIDLAIREANERLQMIDKASGIKDPPLQYSEGTCCCPECHDAGNPDPAWDMFSMALGGKDSRFHRICYKEKEAE